MILAPAEDGGIFLLGISKNNFNSEFFEKAPWQTRGLFEYLKNFSLTENIILASKVDLDSKNDLIAWSLSHGHHWLASLVQFMLRSFHSAKILSQKSLSEFQIITTRLSLRGPPPISQAW